MIHAGDGAAPGRRRRPSRSSIAAHEPVDDARRGGDDLAAVFYTGGTTGRSKGVMLSHLNLLTSALGALASEHFLSRGGAYLHAAPMFHLADLAALDLPARPRRHPRDDPDVRAGRRA